MIIDPLSLFENISHINQKRLFRFQKIFWEKMMMTKIVTSIKFELHIHRSFLTTRQICPTERGFYTRPSPQHKTNTNVRNCFAILEIFSD